ncbi:lipoprotein-releasing ABC transporter permease subunit [Aurantivibrio plasticivorans]
MRTSVPLLIGLRYTRAKRRNQYISFVSGFSLLGMALGVMALIIVLSIMNGLDREMKQRILRVVPHGFITGERPIADWQTLAESVKQHPQVLGAAPYVGGAGLLSQDNRSEWSEIQGVSPEFESAVSLIEDNMIIGSLEDLRQGQWGIVLGRTLARFLGVSGVGDYVTLTTPQFTSTMLGPSPRTKRFRVVGVFEVGAQVDNGLALINVDDARRLYRVGNGVQGLRVKVTDIYQAGAVMSELRSQLQSQRPGKFEVTDWSATQGSLFQAVKMEKIMVMVMLMIIIAIAAFNIVTSLVLMVADKRGDIAVLRTLGMTSRQVMAVFVVQGSATGFIGIVIGTTLGLLGAYFLSDIISAAESLAGTSVFDATVYYIPTLPSQIKWQDIVTVSSVALLLSVLATLYPSYRAANIEPAEALRYE